ncbi:MAG: hypothetical protein MUE31_11740, partial [Candidatus Nanopelagicales bacterium]|nr:hypothetical protein [Candidatus Nanopelagicales bacterium]
NWIDIGCQFCDLARDKEELDRLRGRVRMEDHRSVLADLAAARAVLDTAEVFHGHGGPSYVTIIVGRDPWQAWKDGQR